MDDSDRESQVVGKSDASPAKPSDDAQLAEKVKDLGRKARERLEQERNKRREIVRLDENPTEEKGSVGTVFRDATRKTRSKPSSAIHANSKRKRTNRKDISGRVSESRDVDTWMPDTSNVDSLLPNERSTLVRLFGLPVGVKPEAIRRFFSGLNPERVFVLPSLNDGIQNVMIKGWDSERHDKKTLVRRHESSLRVYVKFDSHPTAMLAEGRSGETLSLEHEENGRTGVALMVKQVPRKVAQYLLQNLAIDGITGCTLQSTVATVEKHIPANTLKLIWARAVRELRLQDSIQSNIDAWLQLLPPVPQQCNPNDLGCYQKLSRHHNKLIDQYKEIQSFLLKETLEDNDSEHVPIAEDTVLRLTAAAANILLSEIEVVKESCHRTRVERRRLLQNIEEKSCN